MLKSARTQVNLILLALLVVASASTAATFLGTKDHDVDHLATDALKHLRQLSNEISLLALVGSQEDAIESAVNTFQQNLHGLQSGGNVILSDGETAIIEPETDSSIRGGIEQIESRWTVFQDSALEVNRLAHDSEARVEAAASLQASSLFLLSAIDQLDDSYEIHMEKNLTNLQLAQTILLISAVSLLTWGISAIRRRVLRLGDLEIAIERIESGETPGPLPQEVYADEVAGLVESFELMRPLMTFAQKSLEARILRRTHEFMTAFEYSQEIVSQTDKHEILRLALTHSMSLVSAHSAALCLIEANGMTLELLALEGRVEANISMPPTKVEKQPYQIISLTPGTSPAELCRDCLFAQACAGENTLRVPLEGSTGQIGSICLAREDGRNFDENERQTLQLLASSVAIAIGNYRLGSNTRLRERQEVIKDERERLAAALHDNLAQTLGYITLKADRAIQLSMISDNSQALDELASIKTATRDAYDSVRGVIDNLSENQAEKVGATAVAINAFVSDYREIANLEVNLSLDEQALFRLPLAAQQQIIHIIRESLTNVLRHAQATSVNVRLLDQGERLVLQIEDNGKGFDPQRKQEGTHLGLTIMQARSRRSGGLLAIDSRPGQGTIISAYFPYQDMIAIHAN